MYDILGVRYEVDPNSLMGFNVGALIQDKGETYEIFLQILSHRSMICKHQGWRYIMEDDNNERLVQLSFAIFDYANKHGAVICHTVSHN